MSLVSLILTMAKDSRFMEMTWQLVNSIGSNARLMISKRIFFELSSKNGRLLSNTALGISRLYRTEIFEIVKSRKSRPLARSLYHK